MQAINTINLLAELEQMDESPPVQLRTYKQRADPFQTLTEEEFQQRYRFSKATITAIVDLVMDDLELDTRGRGTSPALQVLTAIRCWARREAQEYAGDHHGLSQSTTSRICMRVERAFTLHAHEMPAAVVTQLQTMMEEYKLIKSVPSMRSVTSMENELY